MSNNKIDLFKAQFPNAYFFDENNLQRLPEYLLGKGLISHDEKILLTEKPGEGNMNFVRRVVTDKQSFILKQSRHWVEKYPRIEAPVERLRVEANYYQFISGDQLLKSYSPELILHDPDNLILITEDLGKSTDFTFCYKKTARIHEEQIASLLKYISHLHAKDWENQSILFPSNLALRQLNHEHIFVYPYMLDNGFDLDSVQPGLQQLSLPIKNDDILKRNITELGKSYLASGPVLIHGDYYPGSWLLIDREVKVIDPEFAFFGFAEFDLGVMTAHLFMSGMNQREVQNVLSHYNGSPGFDHDLHLGFCGVEILRRIIGLAQIPLEFSLTEKKDLIDLAVDLVNSPETHHFFTYEMD